MFLTTASLPRSHELDLLASEANLELKELLLDLQPRQWNRCDPDEDFKLPASRARILGEIQLLTDQLRQAIEAGANINP